MSKFIEQFNEIRVTGSNFFNSFGVPFGETRLLSTPQEKALNLSMQNAVVWSNNSLMIHHRRKHRPASAAALCALFYFTLTARAAESAYSQAVRADNPMLYYRFEEAAGSSEAADSSTGNHPGTYNDVTLGVQSFNAELGLAAEFDGELSSVSVPALQPAAEFTIEAWIMPNIYSTWNAIYNTEGYPDGAVHFQLIDGNKAEFAMNGNAPEDINFGDNWYLRKNSGPMWRSHLAPTHPPWSCI